MNKTEGKKTTIRSYLARSPLIKRASRTPQKRLFTLPRPHVLKLMAKNWQF